MTTDRSSGDQRLLVVIPTYEEADSIVEVLDRILAAAPDAHVLVVDDSSPDATEALVRAHPEFRERVHLLVRPGKAGLGAAYRAGFGWALHRGYDLIVQMDADLSHPRAGAGLVAALSSYDVAIGSRYVRGGQVHDWTLSRRVISRLGNVYVALVLGLPVRDATAGFKAYRAAALTQIGAVSSQSNGYCFQIENTWQAVRHGLSVVEVPITFTDRTRGSSKMSGSIVAEAVVRVLGWRLREHRLRVHRARYRRLA